MKITCLVLILALSVHIFGQQTTPVVNTDYLQKSKNQKTVGKILLGGGTAMCLIGILVITDDAVNALGNFLNPNPPPDKNNEVLSVVLFVAGSAAIIGSIPLFIAAGRNKRKAASISFKLESLPVIQQQSLVNRSFPAVSISIGFNK